MTVKDLITLLERYDDDCEVTGTWEGQTMDLDVYQAADGRVMVDADGNSYKDDWQQQ